MHISSLSFLTLRFSSKCKELGSLNSKSDMKQHKEKYWLEDLLDFGVITDVASRASIILSKTIDIFFPIEEGRRTGGGREGEDAQ